MKKLIGLVIALLLAGAGAWVIATRVESPAQAAARAEPPSPDPVVATLERGYLQGPVSITATAAHERTFTVKSPAALTGVVTFAGKVPGEALSAGSVLLRANGRPVFVLPGTFALYRDMQPGDSGDDVAATQAGLRAAGYSVGSDRSGTFGAGTQAAIQRLYRAAGYAAPEAAVNAGGEATRDDETNGDEASAGDSSPSTPPVVGPRILMTEFVMIADLPAVVQTVAPVGTSLANDTDLVTLGAGQIVLTATLPTGSLGALTVGATGTLLDDAGVAGTSQVTALTPKTDSGETVVTFLTSGSISPGKSYVTSIDNPAVESGESLLAPVAAIVSRGGRSYLYLREKQIFREVEVQVKSTIGGAAAVEAVDISVPLEAGQEVRIG